ncbi:hypothetical protein BDV96DRAFT_335032 [Lophiotrema nucula]|uniref:Uncharacterized protein n=1 Tax=Lophiotrema nucula TaxID=690887 RepID=A0A6A5YG43_9PLEO|nr:hypothetical protein BDV96DRAFT_335032 [Lophiotrema nucula]
MCDVCDESCAERWCCAQPCGRLQLTDRHKPVTDPQDLDPLVNYLEMMGVGRCARGGVTVVVDVGVQMSSIFASAGGARPHPNPNPNPTPFLRTASSMCASPALPDQAVIQEYFRRGLVATARRGEVCGSTEHNMPFRLAQAHDYPQKLPFSADRLPVPLSARACGPLAVGCLAW